MKRTQRIGALMEILSSSPNEIFSLNYFCDLFKAAKSSISEDLAAVKEVARLTGLGMIETIPGAAGGVRYVSCISDEKVRQIQERLCEMLREESRVLSGGFLYTSDIMFHPATVREMARIFARRFRNCGADYIVTIETKGIHLALSFSTFRLL